MRHLDLFSGIGGFALASSWVWGKDYVNVGHSEIEPYPCKVYHRHFPESECLGDITKIQWREGQADLITGGFPCQPHSVAGARRASEDERDLWGECVRAVRDVRPRYALFENVPGLFTSERGRFFNRVMSDVAAIGYDAEWTVQSAASVGAPHKRDRIWILLYAGEVGRIRRDRGQDSGTARGGEVQTIGCSHGEKPEMGQANRGSVQGQRSHWTHKPEIPLVVNGFPGQLVGLMAIGNAIVPQVAEVILKAIKEVDRV